MHENMVYDKGVKFYSVGKSLCKCLIGSFALLILILLVTLLGFGAEDVAISLAAATVFGFVNVLVILSYLGIAVGSFGLMLYFLGLHYIGLGQIVINTTKTQND